MMTSDEDFQSILSELKKDSSQSIKLYIEDRGNLNTSSDSSADKYEVINPDQINPQEKQESIPQAEQLEVPKTTGDKDEKAQVSLGQEERKCKFKFHGWKAKFIVKKLLDKDLSPEERQAFEEKLALIKAKMSPEELARFEEKIKHIQEKHRKKSEKRRETIKALVKEGIHEIFQNWRKERGSHSPYHHMHHGHHGSHSRDHHMHHGPHGSHSSERHMRHGSHGPHGHHMHHMHHGPFGSFGPFMHHGPFGPFKHHGPFGPFMHHGHHWAFKHHGHHGHHHHEGKRIVFELLTNYEALPEDKRKEVNELLKGAPEKLLAAKKEKMEKWAKFKEMWGKCKQERCRSKQSTERSTERSTDRSTEMTENVEEQKEDRECPFRKCRRMKLEKLAKLKEHFQKRAEHSSDEKVPPETEKTEKPEEKPQVEEGLSPKTKAKIIAVKELFPEAKLDDLIEFIKKNKKLSLEEVVENFLSIKH